MKFHKNFHGHVLFVLLAGIPAAGLAIAFCAPVWMAVTAGVSAQWELELKLGPVLGGTAGMAGWSLLPVSPSARHLVKVLLDSPQFFVMFWNSVRISALSLAGQLAAAVPAAWGLARYRFPGKRILGWLYLALMLMPFQVLMLPEYLVLDRLALLDTHAAVILPMVFSAYPVFLLQQFFEAVPEPILEAARIDGAGGWQLFVRIGIPLGRAGMVSALILNFLESWNLVEQPMTFLKTKSLWTLTLFLPQIGLSDAGDGFAAALLMLLPALLLFLGCQDALEEGIAASAVKG